MIDFTYVNVSFGFCWDNEYFPLAQPISSFYEVILFYFIYSKWLSIL